MRAISVYGYFQKEKEKENEKITTKTEYLEVVGIAGKDVALWWSEQEVMAVVCGGHNCRLGRVVRQGNGSCSCRQNGVWVRERERAERGREELKKSKVDLGIRFQKAEEGERNESQGRVLKKFQG